jgi:peptide/nickel transport system ATP-binding protein
METENKTVLSVTGLKKEFRLKHHAVARAVDGISFRLGRGEILGLVGESGCGKTTTGKLVMRLLSPTAGSISVEGMAAVSGGRQDDIAYRRKVQMVFQDPYASLNPRFRVRDVLEEPLLVHGIGKSRAERMAFIETAMEKVKMTPVREYMDRYPHMLSGGQRQRIATARTLILSPKIIVADEPVSMIDLSTRAEILAMMKGIQREMELSFLYITHDLSTARYFTDRIAVMYLGRIVETGPTDALIEHPAHPYTSALIDAVCEPVSGCVGRLKQLLVTGEIPSATAIPRGCRFHPRCVRRIGICGEKEPPLVQVGTEHETECWVPTAEGRG